MRPFRVSARELQVLELVALGLTNKGIGQLLCLSHRTVDRHLARISRRLGVSGRMRCVMTAIHNDWRSA